MNTKPTISNYIKPVTQVIAEYHSDPEAWDIAMQTLKDIYGMSGKLDWMSYAKLKSMVNEPPLRIISDVGSLTLPDCYKAKVSQC